GSRIDAANGAGGNNVCGDFGVLEGHEHAGLISTPGATSGENHADARSELCRTNVGCKFLAELLPRRAQLRHGAFSAMFFGTRDHLRQAYHWFCAGMLSIVWHQRARPTRATRSRLPQRSQRDGVAAKNQTR